MKKEQEEKIKIEEEEKKKKNDEERKRKIEILENLQREKEKKRKEELKKIEERKRKKLEEEELNNKKKENNTTNNINNNNNNINNNNYNKINNNNNIYKREIPNNTYHKRNGSFSTFSNPEIKFEETPKLNDRSFDGENTYQKPIPNNNNIYGRNTNLIYTKKGMRGRSNEKLFTDNNMNNNNNYMFQTLNNNNYSNNTNFEPYNNYDYSTINTNLNGSFQDLNYRNKNQIYCKSPTRYYRPNLIESRNYGSSKNIFGYSNNDFDFFDNGFDSTLTGLNSMTNIHNFSNYNNINNTMTYSNFTNFNNNNHSHVSLSINLEDLMILEEKLIEIINALNTNKIMHNECFEWWNFYYNCSLFRTIEKAFKGEDSAIVQSSIKYELLTLMLCYDISFNNNLLTKIFIMIKAVLNLNHKNLLIICEHILSKVSNESLGNIWVLKLNDLVNSSKNSSEEESNYISFNNKPLKLIEKIKYNTNSISNDLRIILKNYENNSKTESLVLLYKTINEKNYDDINKFFRENIIRVENPNASVLASYVLRENSNFYTVAPPYLKTQNLKNYTLVLDLDETIIHFKVNPNNDTEGVLRVRPGIFEFLEKLGKYYEIIIFTAATQDYADLLIDAIEENKIYFDYRLYRQHAVIIDNDFVKDLNRLGRPIDKIIIVDNMPQNFRLQKDNGINIRAFWGEDPYDTALIELTPILENIAKEGGDVRKGLAKYRDDIVKKVTSNISKHND